MQSGSDAVKHETVTSVSGGGGVCVEGKGGQKWDVGRQSRSEQEGKAQNWSSISFKKGSSGEGRKASMA